MKRIIAIMLVVSLVFLNLHYQIEEASADMPADTSAIYWYDMWDTMDEFITGSNQRRFDDIGNIVETYKNNQNFNIMGLAEPHNNNYAFIFVLNESLIGTERGYYFKMWNDGNNIVTAINGYIGSGGRDYFRLLGYVAINNGNVVACDKFNIVNGSFGNYISTYNFGSHNASHCIPTYNDWLIHGRYTYTLRPIQKYTTSEYDYTMASNISMEPIIVPFQIVVFWLFGRKYLSTINQRFMIQLDPEKNYNLMQISGIDDANESFVLNVSYDSVMCLGDVATLTGVTFEEVSPLGIYAIDITNYGWQAITSCSLCWSENDDIDILAQASNIPYPVPGYNEDNTIADIISSWGDYQSGYNQSDIIPSDLADTFLGWVGSNCGPCVVQLPTDLFQRQSDMPVTDSIYHFSYALNDNASPWISGYKLDLMNVCIIPRDYINSQLQQFAVRNWSGNAQEIDDDLIGYLSLDQIYDTFDVIIILPQDYNIFDTVIDAVTHTSAYTGYHGLGSTIQGIQYVENPVDLSGNLLYGYCVLTQLAHQKQMLYNFNDGVKSFYNLMSDFCNSWDLWKTSFFEWTVTLNYQLNTIFGTIGNIYSLLVIWDIPTHIDSVATKIDTLNGNVVASSNKLDTIIGNQSLEYTLLSGWDIGTRLESIIDKLDNIDDNTGDGGNGVDDDDQDTPRNYLRYILQFVQNMLPSASDVLSWLDGFQDLSDSLTVPDIVVPTGIPDGVGG